MKKKNHNRHLIAWHTPGQQFVGIFKSKFVVTSNGKPATMYKFLNGDVFFGSVVLDQKLAEVKPDQIVYIEFTGVVTTSHGFPCKQFHVLLFDPKISYVEAKVECPIHD
jgi:hypothetical protein